MKMIDKAGFVKILEAKTDMAVGEYKKYLSAVRKMLDLMPTVDAEPVVHAHWVDGIQCSACSGFSEDEDGDPVVSFSDYCPNCGAKMDEVNEDEHL